MKNLKSLMKKGDFAIIFCIILVSNLPLFFLRSHAGEPNGNTIVVSQYNKIIGTFPLNDTAETKKISFPFEAEGNTYQGILETKNNQVRLLRLPEEVVPKSIHADFSWIGDDSELIVALPVSLMVQVRSEQKKDGLPPEEPEIDAIVN